jgi:CBS domain containing-hemolysin-like protein
LWSVAVLLLVLTSAFLSAAETAVFSVGPARVRTLVEEGFAGSEHLARVRGRSTALQTAVHLLITLLNLVAVGLAVAVGAQIGGMRGSLTALAVIVALLVFAAEILPRAVAARRPIRIALASAPLLLGVEHLVGGLLSPILRLEALLAGVGANGDAEEREVRELADLGREEGVVDHEEHALVERAFRLDELTAFDVMTPRVDVFAWRDARTVADVVPELESVPYSRVPVYGDSIDDVTGILYVRELYETSVAGRGDATLRSLAREPFFVPGSMSLAKLLRDFQARRIHMGIVADEYGGTDGIVTLEDVLEELVGEIVDETDVTEEPLQRVGRDILVADGAVDLRELNYTFNVSLPTLENRSLNGFILDELGYVPQPGESLERGGVNIEILEASETQVVRARLTRSQDADQTAEA